ncbi:MAG: hypothetical protein ACFE95_09025 [Candidatus Hodarchaeota archaeon]
MEVNILTDDSLPSEISGLTLADVVDLSFVQIYLLNILITYSAGAIRFALLNQINDVFFHEKPLHRSTFYNSMQKLEKKGFVFFKEDNKSGTKKSVQVTPLGKIATHMITQMMIFNIWNVGTLLKELVPEIIAKTKLTPVHSILLIHFDELLNVELFDEFYYPYSKELYVLADDNYFNRYLKRGITRVHQSKFQRNTIREPNDFFDMTFLVRYRKTNKFGISEKEMLQEALRVTKINGKLVIISINDIPRSGHFILDAFGEFVKKNPFMFSINEQELKSDLNVAGVENPNLFSINGVLVAWAIVQ